MKALVVNGDATYAVRDVPEPETKPYEAKCKMIACGLCGSDKKIVHGDFLFKSPPIPQYPMIIGHESVGRVVEVGAHVTKFKVGDIVCNPYNSSIGGYDNAWGSFAEYGMVYDEGAAGYAGEMADIVRQVGAKQQVMPAWLAPEQIPMFTVMRETLGTLHHFGMRANESVVVYGAGPIGLAFIRFLSLQGLAPIIALDIVDSKVEKAKELGADYGFNANEPDIVQKVLDICPGGVNHILDAVGLPAAYNSMLPMLAENGQIAVFGIPAKDKLEVDLKWSLRTHWNMRIHFFSMTQFADEVWAHNQVLAMLKCGAVKLEDFISDYVPFTEIVPVLGRFLNNEYRMKVIVTF